MGNGEEKRKPKKDEQGGTSAWMVTFSDLSTLLLTFFVLLLSMSSMDDRTLKSMFTNFTSACGILYFKEYLSFSLFFAFIPSKHRPFYECQVYFSQLLGKEIPERIPFISVVTEVSGV